MNFEVVLFILLVVAGSSGFAIDFIFVSLESRRGQTCLS